MLKKPVASMNISQASSSLRELPPEGLGPVVAQGVPSGYAAESDSDREAPGSRGASLYYGGSLSPAGALGPKPGAGAQRTYRSQRRLELMVRLENAGIPESAMGAMLGISVNRVRHIKKSVEYLAARIKITTGLIVDQDGALADIREQRKEMLTRMLPSALQVIANAVSTPALTLGERRFQHEVARDILDREGTFAKIAKSEVTTAPSFDWSIHEKTSIEILSVAASGSTPRRVGEAEGAVRRVSALQSIIDGFRNSKSLSAEQQQEALESL